MGLSTLACKFPVEPLKWVLEEDGKMNVQAFIDNISFPMTLEELERFADWFNVEEILNVAETEWTAPR